MAAYFDLPDFFLASRCTLNAIATAWAGFFPDATSVLMFSLTYFFIADLINGILIVPSVNSVIHIIRILRYKIPPQFPPDFLV